MKNTTVAQAVCNFCSRTDNNIQVICEAKCLLCSRCQIVPGIRKMLIDHSNIVDLFLTPGVLSDGPTNIAAITRTGFCPLCESPMCHSMLNMIAMFKESLRVQSDDDFAMSKHTEMELEQPNFIATFLRRFRISYGERNESRRGIDPAPAGGEDAHKAETAITIGTSATVDKAKAKSISSTRGIATSSSLHNSKSSKQESEGKHRRKTGTSASASASPGAPDHILKNSPKKLLPSMPRAKAVADQYEKAPTKANIANLLEFIVDCYSAQWFSMLRNGNDSMVTVMMRISNRKKFSQRTNDFKLKGLIDLINSPAGCDRPELFLFGHLLGLQPKMAHVISPGWSQVATSIMVAAHCERCLRLGHLNDPYGNPPASEFKQKIAKYFRPKALNFPKMISLKRAIRIIMLLKSTKQPYWCFSPLLPYCLELNCRLPWQADSIARLLNVLFYVAFHDDSAEQGAGSSVDSRDAAPGSGSISSNPPKMGANHFTSSAHSPLLRRSGTSNSTQVPGGIAFTGVAASGAGGGGGGMDGSSSVFGGNSVASAAGEQSLSSAAIEEANKYFLGRVKMMKSLEEIIQRIFSSNTRPDMRYPLQPAASVDKAAILDHISHCDVVREFTYIPFTLENALDFADGYAISLAEFCFLSVSCWELEHASLKLTLAKGTVTSKRRFAIAGHYDPSNASMTNKERLALTRIVKAYGLHRVDHSEVHDVSTRGIDWDDVEKRQQENSFPFNIPDSLIVAKSRNELNYLASKIVDEIKLQRMQEEFEDAVIEYGPYSVNHRALMMRGTERNLYAAMAAGSETGDAGSGTGFGAAAAAAAAADTPYHEAVTLDDVQTFNRAQYLAGQTIGDTANSIDMCGFEQLGAMSGVGVPAGTLKTGQQQGQLQSLEHQHDDPDEHFDPLDIKPRKARDPDEIAHNIRAFKEKMSVKHERAHSSSKLKGINFSTASADLDSPKIRLLKSRAMSEKKLDVSSPTNKRAALRRTHSQEFLKGELEAIEETIKSSTRTMLPTAEADGAAHGDYGDFFDQLGARTQQQKKEKEELLAKQKQMRKELRSQGSDKDGGSGDASSRRESRGSGDGAKKRVTMSDFDGTRKGVDQMHGAVGDLHGFEDTKKADELQEMIMKMNIQEKLNAKDLSEEQASKLLHEAARALEVSNEILSHKIQSMKEKRTSNSNSRPISEAGSSRAGTPAISSIGSEGGGGVYNHGFTPTSPLQIDIGAVEPMLDTPQRRASKSIRTPKAATDSEALRNYNIKRKEQNDRMNVHTQNSNMIGARTQVVTKVKLIKDDKPGIPTMLRSGAQTTGHRDHIRNLSFINPVGSNRISSTIGEAGGRGEEDGAGGGGMDKGKFFSEFDFIYSSEVSNRASRERSRSNKEKAARSQLFIDQDTLESKAVDEQYQRTLRTQRVKSTAAARSRVLNRKTHLQGEVTSGMTVEKVGGEHKQGSMVAATPFGSQSGSAIAAAAMAAAKAVGGGIGGSGSKVATTESTHLSSSTASDPMSANQASKSADLDTKLEIPGNRKSAPQAGNYLVAANRVTPFLELTQYVDKNGQFTLDLTNDVTCGTQIKIFSLKNANISQLGFRYVLSYYMKTATQLKSFVKLDLSGNRLALTGAVALNAKLSMCCRLVHINVNANKLGDMGLRKILSGVIDGGGAGILKRLDLQDNDITIATTSFALIGQLTDLRSLDLASNCFTLDTRVQCEVFRSGLAPLHRLESLSVAFNKIQDHGFDIISSLILDRSLEMLDTLDVSECFITGKSYQNLKDISRMAKRVGAFNSTGTASGVSGLDIPDEDREIDGAEHLNAPVAATAAAVGAAVGVSLGGEVGEIVGVEDGQGSLLVPGALHLELSTVLEGEASVAASGKNGAVSISSATAVGRDAGTAAAAAAAAGGVAQQAPVPSGRRIQGRGGASGAASGRRLALREVSVQGNIFSYAQISEIELVAQKTGADQPCKIWIHYPRKTIDFPLRYDLKDYGVDGYYY